MSDVDRRERAVQDFVDGRIDERALRRRLAEAGDSEGTGTLGEELVAYRAVWSGLEREPPLELDAGFARRTARAALEERRTAVGTLSVDQPGARTGAFAAAASAATLAASLAAAVLLLRAAGIEVGGPLRRIGQAVATVPTALWGAVGTAAVLYVVDAAWTRGFTPAERGE